MKKFALVISLCIVASGAFAQKRAIKDAQSEIKVAKPNFEEARNTIKSALSNPETQNSAEAWYVAGLVENAEFTSQKEKLYDGEQPDNNIMYPALDRVLPFLIKADSLDMLPDAKGKVKSKFRKDIKLIVLDNRPFYANAASYFYEKKNYQKAYENFKVYGDIPKLAMFEGDLIQSAPLAGDTLALTIRYYAALAAALIPNSEAAIEIFEEIKDMGYEEDDIYKQLASQYHQKQDTANYLRILESGINKFPQDPYYILNLINVKVKQGETNQAHQYLLKAIEISPNDPQLYDALGVLYEENKEMDKAIENIKKALAIKPDYVDALTHLGRIYYNFGVEKRNATIDIEDNKLFKSEMEKVNASFKDAIPYFEKAYDLNPKDMDTISALRNIYYSLGMNAEYEKMDKIYSGK